MRSPSSCINYPQPGVLQGAEVHAMAMQVRGLARALRLKDAFGAIEDVRRRGVPLGDEVPFGHVVNSPMAPGTPLTVVQPHEGCKVWIIINSNESELFLQCSSRSLASPYT